MYRLSKRSRKNMIGLHPIMGFFIEMLIKETKQDFGILNSGGVRTNKQQAYLYAQGRTREGNKVTWTLDSYHVYGLACDTVAYNNSKFNWEVKNYKEIIKAGESIIEKYDLPIQHAFDAGLKYDYPHWQMSGYKPYYDIRKFS